MQIPETVVVRTYAPARRRLMLVTLVALTTVALYLLFELGRYQGGYDAVQAAAERGELQQRIEQLQTTQHELRVQLAAADEAKVAQVRERAELGRTIGELQGQVADQRQDLEFYRGIAQQGPPAGVVRVQQLHIAASPEAQKYVLRFSLNRPLRAEEGINGALGITVDGTRDGAAASIDLAALTGGKSSELPFNFRYYANIEQPITLPPDFKPERLTIEVRPGRKGGASYRQTFVWVTETA
jgi:hypothetical protein